MAMKSGIARSTKRSGKTAGAESTSLVLKSAENVGEVYIADDVVAAIACLAAAEVDGVDAGEGGLTGDIKSKVGVKNHQINVKPDISGNSVRLGVSLSLHYGYPIPSTCQQVQKRVKSAVETMTGMNVTDVDIRVSGVTQQ